MDQVEPLALPKLVAQPGDGKERHDILAYVAKQPAIRFLQVESVERYPFEIFWYACGLVGMAGGADDKHLPARVAQRGRFVPHTQVGGWGAVFDDDQSFLYIGHDRPLGLVFLCTCSAAQGQQPLTGCGAWICSPKHAPRHFAELEQARRGYPDKAVKEQPASYGGETGNRRAQRAVCGDERRS